MKISEILGESATGGSTGAGAIASVASPMGSILKRPSIFGNPAPTPKKKKKKKKVKESMDFNAGKLEVTDDHPHGIFRGLLSKESYYDFSQPPWNDPKFRGGPGFDEEPPKNPNYRPEEEMHVSNENAREILGELGLNMEDNYHFNMEINEFLAHVTQWLKGHIGKRTAEEPVRVSKESDGPTMVGGGKHEGYFNEAIMHMSKLARLGKERGATHVWLT